jgi:hypothetical protein
MKTQKYRSALKLILAIITVLTTPCLLLADCEEYYLEYGRQAKEIIVGETTHHTMIPYDDEPGILTYTGRRAYTWDYLLLTPKKGVLALTAEDVSEQNYLSHLNALMVAGLIQSGGETDVVINQYMALQLEPEFPKAYVDVLVSHILLDGNEEDLFCRPDLNGQRHLWTWKEMRHWLRFKIGQELATGTQYQSEEPVCKNGVYKGKPTLICNNKIQ